MTRQKENQVLKHFNRGFIALFSLIGMLMDGAQCSDAILQLAVIYWLWMPELQTLEVRCLRRVEGYRTRVTHHF